jgi:serine protease AprX
MAIRITTAVSVLLLSAAVSAQVSTDTLRQTSQLKTSLLQSTTTASVLPSVQPSSPYEDNYHMVHSAEMSEKGVGKISTVRLDPNSASLVQFKRDKMEKILPPTVERIHPVLVKWLETRDPNEYETLILTFKDNINIPRFPNPRDDLPRDAKENLAVDKETQNLISQLQVKRRDYHDRLAKVLFQDHGAEMLDNFWLVNGLVVKMPLGQVKEMLTRQDLLYVEPQNAGEKPPAGEVLAGRQSIVSDPYFNLGQAAGYIGLLDTGMRFTHTQFNSPSTIDFRYDCTSGICTNTPDVTDDCWNHGTSTAAIITGNNNLGNLYRGITRITLDSFKVYPAGCGGLDGTATVKAFEKAVAILDRVIVAEMQSGGGINSSISTAANNAFNAGAVIIAANGNNGSAAGTVNAPANAHRVLGVGNFDVLSQAQIAGQSRGPTSDNRIKPDIQAPTNTRTASNASDTATKSFGGTSGATPYASGAAALMRNWLRGNTGSIDPGQVYSHLILSGQQKYPFNNTSGAGPLKMPTGGVGYWGKTAVNNGLTIDIPISVGAGKTKIEGALWWPESSGVSHNDVDLHLISPSGTTVATSLSVPSVFERTGYETSALATGTWKLRIRGYSVPAGPQTVYWSGRVK